MVPFSTLPIGAYFRSNERSHVQWVKVGATVFAHPQRMGHVLKVNQNAMVIPTGGKMTIHRPPPQNANRQT